MLREEYLSIGELDVFLGHALEEHLLGYEVGGVLALLAVQETHLIDFAVVALAQDRQLLILLLVGVGLHDLSIIYKQMGSPRTYFN